VSHDQQLIDLTARIQELRREGKTISLEEACAACPERVEEVRQALQILDWYEDKPLAVAPGEPGGEPTGLDQPPPVLVPGERFLPGTLLADRYRVVSALDHVGMGVVYKALDTRLPRHVALKFLPPDYATDPQRLERFKREAETVSKLNHPNIYTLYDIEKHDGKPFLVMEFVEGQTMRALVGQGRDIDALAHLVAQVAKALRAAHLAGVVHRDIKPENIMVRADGQVKVLDFGLARQAGSTSAQTELGKLVGTLRYMSPEQARGEAVDQATDVFSLGIVLYELVTDRHPFEASTEIATLCNIKSETPLPPRQRNPALPIALTTLIQQMLAKEARARLSAEEVERVLLRLSGEVSPHVPPPPPPGRPTVGRQQELKELLSAFETVVEGRGLLVCVAGEPGLGKSTLVEKFLEKLRADGHLCRVARGRCSERLAGTEAYLPILEALESGLRAEGDEAEVPLLRRLAPSWYVQVAPLAEDDAVHARVLAEARAATQERLKRELTALIRESARTRPLVVFFDDFQWADASTVDLLGYLAPRLDTAAVLLVVTYRRTDLVLGRHPFLALQHELQARGICREIALGFLAQDDVADYLNRAFPGHRFPAEFAARIHARTEGNPLFMADLLRWLRDRGVITRTADGWVLTQPSAVQHELPESVRGLIERKLDRLKAIDRRLLVAASVQGNEFEAAVVARALGADEAKVEERLDALERVHAFVQCVGEREFPDRTLTSRYRFVHVLYQNALYATLRPARRAALSKAVAQALRTFHGDRAGEVAGELAMLLEAAREFLPAAEQFLTAAQNAAQLFAHQEAVALTRRGLALLESVARGAERDRLEIRLRLLLGTQLQFTRGYAAPEAEEALLPARQLGACLDDLRLRVGVMWGLFAVYLTRAEYGKARELAEDMVEVTSHTADPALRLLAWHARQHALFCLGDLVGARAALEEVLPLCRTDDLPLHGIPHMQDPRVTALGVGANVLRRLGFPDQALGQALEGLALARRGSSPQSLVWILFWVATVHYGRGDLKAACEEATEAVALATEHGFPFWLALNTICHGWTLALGGQITEGIAEIERGLAASRTTGGEIATGYALMLLADAYGQVGRVEEALTTLDELEGVMRRAGERYNEPEVPRQRGELLLRQAGEAAGPEAEACFQQALTAARQMQAKSFELRAATSLARLWQRQGRSEEARQLLQDVYDWFTEGFDTIDLRQAKTLLDELSESGS
jgi:tetratricopeptide (TPR) repeat protein